MDDMLVPLVSFINIYFIHFSDKFLFYVISSGLRKLLVPILVGLLESVRRRQWTFDNFFHASKDITSRRIVHVFSVSNCSQNRLYLGREEGKRSVDI